MFITQSGEELLQCPLPPRPFAADRRWKPSVEIAPNCPRCNSSNTKFCYYNNYSLTQPRYFCKTCRRYWTKGGSLRNVPVGGGCRKNRRSRSAPTPTNRVSTGSSQSMGGHQYGQNADSYGNGTGSNSSNNLPRCDASTIDLAVVYAKFLNQQPDSSPGLVMPGLPREFDSPFDVLSVSDTTADTQLRFKNTTGATSDPSPETNLSDGPHHIFLDEFENYEEQERFSVSQSTGRELNHYALQPLPPSEKLVVQDIYWPHSPVAGTNFSWQASQLQLYDPIITDHHHHNHHHHHDSSLLHHNPLDDNWSSFDLSNFDDFPRP